MARKTAKIEQKSNLIKREAKSEAKNARTRGVRIGADQKQVGVRLRVSLAVRWDEAEARVR